MALTVDADWFQLRFFITGSQIIISDQFVSPVCSSVMNFSIVTTSALFCDSMIVEIAQIGDVRKIPCREIFSAGDSCLYGPCVLILNCMEYVEDWSVSRAYLSQESIAATLLVAA